MEPRIIKYKLKPDTIYVMTKLLQDGRTKVMSHGQVYSPIEVGCSCMVGNWVTTEIQDIVLTGKGVLIETMNSTYLIEEFNGFMDVINPEDKYEV